MSYEWQCGHPTRPLSHLTFLNKFEPNFRQEAMRCLRKHVTNSCYLPLSLAETFVNMSVSFIPKLSYWPGISKHLKIYYSNIITIE